MIEKLIAILVAALGLLFGGFKLKQMGKEQAESEHQIAESKAMTKSVIKDKKRHEKIDNLEPDELVNELLKSSED